MKIYKLPIIIPPIIGYLHHAHPLSIILNYKESHEWFYSNYIQLCCEIGLEGKRIPFNFYGYEASLPEKNYPFLNIEKISKNVIQLTQLDICTFLIKCIDLGYYVRASIDRYYIKTFTKDYKENHKYHEVLLFGFDNDEKTFLAYGYVDGFFKEAKISFHDFSQAFLNCLSQVAYQNDVYLFKYNGTYQYQFDINLVTELLNDYLCSNNTSKRLSMFKNPLNLAFGIRVYHYIKQSIEVLFDNKHNYDIRPLHILWEHKKVMIERIKFMEMHGYIRKGKYPISLYYNIEKEVLILRNKLIRYKITEETKILKDILNAIDRITLYEKNAIELLLNEVHNSNIRS